MEAVHHSELNDKKIGLISSFLSILVLFILLYISNFEQAKEEVTIPIEVMTEIPLEEFIEQTPPKIAKLGGGGGGTPTDAPVDPTPKAQTEKIVTNNTSDVKVNSGKSSNTNSPNGKNTSSTTEKAPNPFGDGGTGGGSGGGKGKGTGLGRDEGSGSGSGGGNGNTSKPRIRINDPNTDNISSDMSCKISLKLSVNAEGDVVRAENIPSKTTTTNQVVINQLIANVKNQVKYNKKEGASLEMVFLTVNISAK